MLFVQMLLDYGAEVNATFWTLEMTALMTSLSHSHARIVRMLLRHGASAQAVDKALRYASEGIMLIDRVVVLCPTRHKKIGHYRDVSPSRSRGLV